MINMLKQHIDDDRCYRVIGTPPNSTLVGAGFMNKRYPHGIDWGGGVFRHFAACLVLRGKGSYIRQDGFEIPLQPGSVFFRIPGVSHSNLLDPESGWLEFFVAFELRSATPQNPGRASQQSLAVMARQILMLDVDHPVHRVALDGAMLHRCEAFLDLLKTGEQLNRATSEGLRLMMDWISESPPNIKADSMVDELCAILNENAGNRRPLPELATGFPLSYVRLRERFCARVGKSMGEYRLDCRMDKAEKMLRQGLTVKEVAYKPGYGDPFAFSKQFHQIAGVPPSQLFSKPSM